MNKLDELITKMVEKKIEKISLKSFINSLDSYINYMGINVKRKRSGRKVVEKAYHIRNIWVHNGGKVDQKFIEKSGIMEVSIGNFYHINKMFLKDFKQAIFEIQQEIHDAFEESYFK